MCCRGIVVFVWFWNEDDCGTFSGMKYWVSIEGNIVHFCEYLMASGPGCFRCLIFMPSGPVELLFVLFKMPNCTCVVVSCIFSNGRVLIVWSMWLLILFVYME